MSKDTVFVDRRHGARRTEPDPCNNMKMDLYHRKRRKSTERRDTNKSLTDDYYAFIEDNDDAAADSISDE